MVVAVDETLVRKHRRDLPDQNLIWVFGAIEHDTGTVALEVIPRSEGRTSEFLINLIKKYVTVGTTIYSDGLAFYKGLLEAGNPHCAVNHSIEFARHGENGLANSHQPH